MSETPEQRSRTMRAVRSKNTASELTLRRLLHHAGYRFRLHRKDLPGSPDLVFHGRKAVIFVHGCFWHGHNCTRGARVPKSNQDYWIRKISRNCERDARNISRLTEAGWKTLVVWECELKNLAILEERLREFLSI